MKTRVASLSIIVENTDSVEELNEILSGYREYVIGRMGIPYRERNINVICVVMDAPQNEINSLAGKLGKLEGVSSKINFSNVFSDDE